MCLKVEVKEKENEVKGWEERILLFFVKERKSFAVWMWKENGKENAFARKVLWRARNVKESIRWIVFLILLTRKSGEVSRKHRATETKIVRFKVESHRKVWCPAEEIYQFFHHFPFSLSLLPKASEWNVKNLHLEREKAENSSFDSLPS